MDGKRLLKSCWFNAQYMISATRGPSIKTKYISSIGVENPPDFLTDTGDQMKRSITLNELVDISGFEHLG